LPLPTKAGIRGVSEAAPARPAVIKGRSGRILASSSFSGSRDHRICGRSSETSRLPLGKPGSRGMEAPAAASAARPRGRARGRTRASSSWSVGEAEGQILIRYGKERSRKLTIRLRSWGTGDRNGQGVDGQSADGEEGEGGFGEHDVVRKKR